MSVKEQEKGDSLPRQVTAIATVGSMGQTFSIYEKNWTCNDCNQENYANRQVVFIDTFCEIYSVISACY